MPSKTKQTQPETPEESQGRDNFQTPNYAVDLLIPYIPKHITSIWEPAAGGGKITMRLLSQTQNIFVSSSDIKDTVFPTAKFNFLSDDRDWVIDSWVEKRIPFCIITNPPFSLKKQFFEKCIKYDIPFALLIPFDMSQWLCRAFYEDECQALIPDRRINYITPTGKSQLTGHTANFHSFWLTKGFNLPHQMTFVNLSLEEMKNNI